jgi:hypothetical protein
VLQKFMRSLCQLSTRWHQQFFRTAELTGHQHCLRQLQPLLVRPYRVARGRRGEVKATPVKRDVIVREYDQLGKDASTRTLVDPRTEIQRDEEALVAKINELEKELAIMREGPFGPNSELIQSVPKEYRAQVLKELEEAGLMNLEDEDFTQDPEFEKVMDDDGIFEDDHDEKQPAPRRTAVTLRIPKRQKEYVKKFNVALENVGQGDSKVSAHLVLWQWYLRCQQHVSNFSNVIPEDVWQVLWKSVLERAYRPKHVIVLAKDMQAADMELDGNQKLAYIEALLAENDAAQALSYWKEVQSWFEQDSELSSRYWPLGVRLYATLGRPKKAQEIAFGALTKGSVTDGEILVPVVSAWANSDRPNAEEKVWACYLQLRRLMGNLMNVNLYQKVSGALLQSGHADMALAVYKDMISSQEKSVDDSTDIYRQAIDHFQDVQPGAITEENINRVGLSALTIFPKRFQNKFFFGSWIKMLIGRGDIDAAATVVELMYERGVKLDAKHLNGIVGAWLREGSPIARQKAEALAWSMVNARVELVKRRMERTSDVSLLTPGIDTATGAVRESTRHLPAFLRRAAPPANIETFSILLLHYTRRSDTSEAENLTQVMTGPADMRPNSFIMNHWLYNALRSADVQGVWDKYSSLKQQIKPDLETFAALWDTAKVQYDSSRIARAEAFPHARLLFAEMVDWLESLSKKQLAAAKEDFSKDLYETIIRCFQLSSDTNGLLCAMHGLKAHFNVYPDITTTRTVMFLVSRTLPKTALTGPARMRQRRAHLQNSLKMISGILDAVAAQRQVDLIEQGIDLEKLDPEDQISKQAQLDILSDFLLTIRQRSKLGDGNLQHDVQAVAKSMKVDSKIIDFKCLRRSEGSDDVD